MPEHTAGPRRRLAIVTLAFGACVVVTTEFIVIGLLPLLAQDLAVSLQAAGWLVSAFALSAAVAGPAMTLTGGAWQPRYALAGGLLAFGVAGVTAGLLPSYGILLTARVVQGAVLTLFISVASATAAASAPAGSGGRAVGHVNLGTVVAVAIVVPAGVALAEAVGWRPVIAGLGALAIIAAGIVLATIRNSPSPPASPFSSQLALLRQPRFAAHLSLSGLLFTAMFVSYSYVAALLEQEWQLSRSEVAFTLLGFGVAGIVGNWLASLRVDRGPTQLTVAVTAALAAATAVIWLTPGPHPIGWTLIAVWGAAHTAAFVVCQVRVMFAAPGAEAFAGSLNIAVCNLGIAAGAALGGWISSRFGIASIGAGTAAVGIMALLVGLGLGVRVRRGRVIPGIALQENPPPHELLASRRGDVA